MPGNEVADKVHNFFEQGNSSQVQRQPQLASGSWPVRNGHLWVGNQRQTESPLSSNLSTYDINQSDSGRANGREFPQMSLGTNLTQLSLRPQTSGNQHPNLNGFVHGRQGFQTRQNHAEFLGDDTLSNQHNLAQSNQHNLARGGLSFLEQQQGNAPENGSASARTPERLEVAESPVNFNLFGVQQQLMRGQQSGMPQPRPGEQLGLNDMQLWQQQLMFKQVQELQRQQQLQQLDQESRELNRMNQFSTIARQPAGDHLPALINGTPIHDASNSFWPAELMRGDSKVPSTSQMSMVGSLSRMQHGGSSALQGIPSGVLPSDDHGQVLRSTGFVPQQLEQSFYGTPVANMRGGFNQFSPLQGISHESVGMLTKPSGHQLEKSPMQSSAFSNSFQVDRSAAFQDQVNMQGTSLVSKQGFHGKNILGQTSFQGLNTGFQPESFQQMGSLARNTSAQEFQGRQHQAGWMSNLQEKATNEVGSSHGSVSLDATEEKILFSSDDNPWDAPIDGSGIIAGGYGNPSESTEYFNAFPSIQSGTWSALMQSAVAEASSSDTGLHDEWSGLSYQKAEVSTGHQPATLSDSAVQQKDWVDKNLHSSSSLTSRSFPLFDDRNMNRSGNSVPGYQQPSIKFSCEQSERLQPDASLEATQEPSKEVNQWLNHSTQPKSHVEGSHLVQPPMHLGNAWPGPSYVQSEGASHSRDMELNAQDMHGSWVHHQSQSSYNIDSQSCDKPNGWNMNESVMPNGDATLKIHGSGSTMQHSQINDLKIGMHMERDHDGMWKAGDNRAASSFSNLTGGFEQVKSGIGSHHVIEEGSHMNNFTAGPNSNSVKTNQETNRQRQSSHQLDHGKHVGNSSLRNKGDDSEANYQPMGNKETSSDSYNSNQSHHIVTGRMRENSWLNANEPCSSGSGYQKSMGQGGQKAPISRRFQFHPMGNLGVNMEPVDTTNQFRHSQNLSRQIMGGSKTVEQGNPGYSNFVSHVSNNAINMEKGHLPDIQENVIRSSEEPSRGLPPQHDSTVSPSDGSPGYYSQNRRPVQTCQNMLQLFNKVDQSRENNTHFGSSDRIPEEEVSDASVSHLQHSQSAVSQGFGLRLAPPSQRLPVPNHAFSPQNSSPTVNDLNSRHFNSEVGERSQTSTSVQPLSHEVSHRDHWDKNPSISGQTSNETQPLKSAAFSSYASPYQRNQLQHQQMSTSSAEIVRDQPGNVSFSRLASQQRDTHDTHNRIVVDQSVQASLPGTASRSLPSNRIHPLDTNQPVGTNSSFGRASGQHLPVLESVPVPHPSATLSSFTTNLHNVWTNVPTQQGLAGPPHNNPPNFSQSISPSKSNPERTWVQKQDGQGISKMGNSSEFGTGSISSHRFANAEEQLGSQIPSEQTHQHQTTAGAPQGQESAAKIFQDDNSVSPDSLVTNPHHQVHDRGRYGKDSDLVPQTEHASLRNHTISNRDIEAFGRSLKQSHAYHQNYSLLQQVQAMKGMGTDPNNRVGKRFKGSDSGSDSQQVSANAGEQSFDGHCTIVRDVVDKELNATSLQKSFSSREDQNINFPSQLVRGDVSSQNMCTFGRNDSTNCSSQLNASPARSENPQINPRMAPSWFEQFGTFKNGKMVPIHDQRKAETAYQRFFSVKVSENLHTHSPVEQVNASVATQLSSASQCTASALVASESFSPPLSVSSEVPDQSLTVLRPKKRKNETVELVQWHKEVIDGSQRLLNISMAEQDWAQAANRLVEKVDDEVEMVEDGQPILRPRRRLILTTQLMQQILRPAPPAVLSSDATKFHETLTYFVAKLQLGDACSLISSSKSDSRIPTGNGNQTSEKLKTSERVVGDQSFSKAVEDFIGRAKKLEADLLRLDKTSTILDLRQESQDLEKFSVMNRFAIFHGRSQSDVTETSSSANAAAGMPPQKTCPQRYITPVSIPRNLPQGVQCLSL